MKKLLVLCVAVLIASSLSSFLPSRSDFALYDNVIRLHVIANSDTDEDQALKLFVRDRILEYADRALSDIETKTDAEASVADALDEIEAAAAEAIADYGADRSVKATLTTESYPRRSYGTVTLPEGKYTSLRIIIGDGDGQNWWCVLFPRMCTRPAVSAEAQEDEFIEAGFTPSQYKIITDSENKRYTVKFRIIELVKNLFD